MAFEGSEIVFSYDFTDTIVQKRYYYIISEELIRWSKNDKF